MSFLPDLHVIKNWEDGYSVLAVAWLTDLEAYTKGPASHEFLDALHEHIEAAWQPFFTAGFHECELCDARFPEEVFCASFNLFVPAGPVLYFAPAMIEHYVLDHSYQPPREFIEALLASPAQQSTEYFQAIRPFAERWTLLRSGLNKVGQSAEG